MDRSSVKKVHVVYKTHLDVGFTDLGQNVLDRYVQEHIPHAIDLAMEMNTPENKKFIWTVGSYLVDYYQRHAAPEAVEKMRQAVRLGYFRWHGIACTTHTELMDQKLFEYDLSLSKKLDQEYGVHTIAAKMTDVPAHTIGIVRLLADAGIQYLHIGVNPSSMVPRVPEVFVWRQGDREIMVHYSADYGKELLLDGFDEVLEFAHTGDNRGPQDAAAVQAELDRIQEKYPNARVEASTLDNFAQSLLRVKHLLPVLEEELGDSWIHGTGTDPWKTARYEELCRLMDRWLEQGKVSKDSPAYSHFMENLMLVAEHTWGMDLKTYLPDYLHWAKRDFEQARKADLLTDGCGPRPAGLVGGEPLSYSRFERSHQEQRDYLFRALELLPEECKAEANATFDALIPAEAKTEGWTPAEFGSTLEIGGWKVRFSANGAVTYLEKDGKAWVNHGEMGKLEYEVFDAKNCFEAYCNYNRDFLHTKIWSEPDFSKPGLETAEELEHRCYSYHGTGLYGKDSCVLVTLNGDGEASEAYGAPRKAQVFYSFGEEKIGCRLQWLDKDANRIPEAIWFRFQLAVENPNRWMMEKLGCMVSPLNVASGGNRKQHCVQRLAYTGADGMVEIKPLHSPLVSVGGRNLYQIDDRVDDLAEGFYFNLYNNRWGTNFKMWCEDDCTFDYELTFRSYR